LFDEKLTEDDLKKIETFCSISGLNVKVYFDTCAFVKLFSCTFAKLLNWLIQFELLVNQGLYRTVTNQNWSQFIPFRLCCPAFTSMD